MMGNMDLQSIESFMAIGAHCDDVDLRCGGTFTRLAGQGKRGCYVVCVENAYTSEEYKPRLRTSSDALAIRRAESTRGSQIIGATRLEWLEMKSYYLSTAEPGSRIYPSFDSMEALAAELEDVIFAGLPPVANADRFESCCRRLRDLLIDFEPQIVFTHTPDDRHGDHYAVSRFVEHIVRQLNDEGARIELWFWEPGSKGAIVAFEPNFYVELSAEHVAVKQNAVDCYASQFPRGTMDTFAADRAERCGRLAGMTCAEAFRRGASPHGPSGTPAGSFCVDEDGAERLPAVWKLPPGGA